MALVGYVTLEEANQYIQGFYSSKDPLRASWDALTDADREALLRKSFQVLELLPFTGHKTTTTQTTAFPRCPSETVPDDIKFAQIENALSKSGEDADEEAQHYDKLWLYGVSSYSIGNLSEKVSVGEYGAVQAQQTGITSVVAARLLQPYLNGGYRI